MDQNKRISPQKGFSKQVGSNAIVMQANEVTLNKPLGGVSENDQTSGVVIKRPVGGRKLIGKN